MECELNGRLIKLEDGEVYWLRTERIKIPKWILLKPTIEKNYKIVKIYGRQFSFHRIIYYIHNQEWNIYDDSRSNLIDHIDRNTLNNNIENLRPATHQQNMWNRKGKGYSITKYGTFRVNLTRGNCKINKTYKTEQEAIDVVTEYKSQYNQF